MTPNQITMRSCSEDDFYYLVADIITRLIKEGRGDEEDEQMGDAEENPGDLDTDISGLVGGGSCPTCLG